MEQFVLKFRKDIIAGLAFLLIATVAFGVLVGGVLAEGDNTDNVGITAQIEAWATLSITEESLTLAPYMVDSFGDVAIASSTTGFAAATNHGDGLTINISSANGALEHGGSEAEIETVLATGTALLAGDDGYGVQCVSGSGVTCHSDFLVTGDDVSPVTDTGVTFATATGGGVDRTGTLVVKAASDKENPVGDYTDTITLTATPGID